MATSLKKCPVGRSRRAGWPGPSRARLCLLLAIALIADGCATSGSQPGTTAYKPYKERAETQAQGDLSVTVALPTAAEAADVYGADLAEKAHPAGLDRGPERCGCALLVPHLRPRSQLLRRV